MLIEARGFKTVKKKVKVKKGKESSLKFKLKPAPAEEVTSAPEEKEEKPAEEEIRVEEAESPSPALAPAAAEAEEKIVLATDPSTGEFIKTLPEGSYIVEVEAAGYLKQKRQIVITRDREAKVEFIMEPVRPRVGTILGTVRSKKEKEPLAAILTFDQPGVPNLATNPETGEYIGTIPPGTYQVTAHAQDYLPEVKTLEIEMGDEARVDFGLSPTEVPVELGDLRGVVADPEGKAVPGVISFPGSEVPNVAADPETGKYFLKLPPGDYKVKAAAVNYKSQAKAISIIARQATDLNFVLEPLVKVRLTKKKIQILETIHFEQDKAKILPDSYPLLNEVVQVLEDNPGINIVVEGHTDNVGSDDYNLKLSEARAKSVKMYLQWKGIGSERIRSVGYGEGRPLADNSTALGRAKNRRVEFVIQD